MIKQYWDKIPHWGKNRYALTVFALVIWMIFFDSRDVFMMYKLKKELNTIRQEKEYFEKEIEVTRADLDNLLNDNDKIERYAREKYLMKNANEEIFVISVEE
jgi:cell division protein FtsB